MKKRLISMALAVSMAVSIMPAPALATVGGGGTTLGDDAITLSDAMGGTSSGTATPFRFDGADSCCYKRRKCPIERQYYVNRHSLYQ